MKTLFKKWFPHLTNIDKYSQGDIIAVMLLIMFTVIGLFLALTYPEDCNIADTL